MPTLEAMLLDLGCPVDKFSAFCDAQFGLRGSGLCQYTQPGLRPAPLGSDFVNCGGAVEHLRHKEKIFLGARSTSGSWYYRRRQARHAAGTVPASFTKNSKRRPLKTWKGTSRSRDSVHPESPASVVALADVVGRRRKSLLLPNRCQTRCSSWQQTRAYFTRCSNKRPENCSLRPQRRVRGNLSFLRPLPVDGHERSRKPG